MSSLSPLAIVLGIIFGLAVLGAVIALGYNLRKFAGFRQIARDAEKIADSLGGELFRDGGDLVVSGNFGRLPTVVRFSNKEDVPGLNIRMGVPANFTLWIAPRSSDPGEGRATVRTGDAGLDSRFITRSDDPGQARLFLALQTVPRALRQVACSNGSFFAITPASVEISELVIPAESVAAHVLEHLQSVTTLAAALKHMPAADTVKVEPLHKERRILGRAAIVVGAITAVVVVIAATQRATHKETSVLAQSQTIAAGVLPVDATRILGMDGWRAAAADDFDADAAAWLRSTGAAVTGRIVGDFSGRGGDQDVAYVLVRSDGVRRIVLLANGEDRYDVRYPGIAIAARIPKSSLQGIQWSGPAPLNGDGDGLLIVRNAGDPQSGLVLLVAGSRIVTAVPANYQN
ncbi:MAG TPA: hypothetical protein VLC12_01910, partial [Terriglobales bacterium]|nr:hypothetical protein [Terriglobales bacterium]